MYILRRRFDVRFLVQMTFSVNSKCNLINVILIFVIFVIFYEWHFVCKFRKRQHADYLILAKMEE